MILEFPWPPKELTPNFKRRNHWTKYSKQTKAYRELCGWIARESIPFFSDVEITMTVTFYPPDKRKRDDDGMIGSFKAGRDGIADGWRVDDNLFRVTYKFGEVFPKGKVEVEIGV